MLQMAIKNFSPHHARERQKKLVLHFKSLIKNFQFAYLNLLKVINLKRLRLPPKYLKDDAKLLPIKNESKQFKSNLNRHFIMMIIISHFH